MAAVQISYFSDVLCIWAFAAERRIQELVDSFGDQINIEAHYCSVFPDAWSKIKTQWATRGGFEGFNKHLNEVAEQFPHMDVHRRLWLDVRPRTSASAHMFLKAIELIDIEQRGQTVQEIPYLERKSTITATELRKAFFVEAKDISNWEAFEKISDKLGIGFEVVQEKIQNSEAVANLAEDYDLSRSLDVKGSPTFHMNNGRQKLFGNVGYRLLEANVQELLRNPSETDASWC